jgi:polyisoprenoid-binding protein YceI
MKTMVRLLTLCAALSLASGASAADMLKYRGQPKSKMVITGTSTIHDWSAESGFVSGSLELDPSFPTDPSSRALKPGKVEATANVSILVRTFRCSSGAAMDAIMQETLDAKKYPKIEFKLTALEFKEFKDDALTFEATGDILCHGQTKTVTMPVEILRKDSKNLVIKGATQVKMTDFGVQPPAPKIALGAIKTADEVTLKFEWNVQQVTGS